MRVIQILTLSLITLTRISARNIYEPKNVEDFYRNEGDGDLELGEYDEGDMRFEKDSDESEDESDEGGTGFRDTIYRWPKEDGEVIVPYEIDEEQRYSLTQIENIEKAMRMVEAKTCVRFQEQWDQDQYLFITKINEGCWSYIGKTKKHKKQTINFAHHCTEKIPTMAHELIHALGFFHMQSHTDRDKYVRIDKDNIKRDKLHNFMRVDSDMGTNFRTPYDYYSIMHYGPKAFSKNKENTIITKDPKYMKIIGQRNLISPGDFARINHMYECDDLKLDDAIDSESESGSNEDSEDKDSENSEEDTEEKDESSEDNNSDNDEESSE